MKKGQLEFFDWDGCLYELRYGTSPFKSPGIMIYYGAFECLETIVHFERKKLPLGALIQEPLNSLGSEELPQRSSSH